MEQITEIKYDTTKEQCQAMIDDYGGVCAGCGGKLSPIETVNNSGQPTYWSGCTECSVLDWGVPKEIFEIAKMMVTEQNYVHYGYKIVPYDKTPEGEKYWLASQIRGTTRIVLQVLNTQKELQKKATEA